MTPHERFHFSTPDQLLEKAASLGIGLPFSGNPGALLEPLKTDRFRLPNRFIVHPMEGFDADEYGAPGRLTFRRYRRFTSGGSGLIWFEATSVVQEGRSNPRQLLLNRKNLDAFRRLVDAARKEARSAIGPEHDPLFILQLTHSGRYAKPAGKPDPVIPQANPFLDPRQHIPAGYPLISDDELDRLQERFSDAASLAQEAGFDGVDIKACHYYLVNELLASRNRAGSRYGGSFGNRIRFLREVSDKIKERCPDLILACRLSLYDGIDFPYGFGTSEQCTGAADLEEPLEAIRALVSAGLGLLNLSAGNPYILPHMVRPFDRPVRGAKMPPEHPLLSVERLIRLAGACQKAFPGVPVVGTGYSWLRHLLPFVAAGVLERGLATLIGQGRNALAYPDSVKDLAETGSMNPKKTCITCSCCTELMRGGGPAGCVIRDREIYAPEYRRIRASVHT
jgi:2,4-dienoyl-CoA reductase-like NADH-dependent reductase (Old Yellow Enzyme family)